MKWHRLYKESKEMKSYVCDEDTPPVYIDDEYVYFRGHEYHVGDEVLVLSDLGEHDDDYDYFPGKLIKIYKMGSQVVGDVLLKDQSNYIEKAAPMDDGVAPIWAENKPKTFSVRFNYSHRSDDEHEFTARSKEDAMLKFNKWAADMECSEDFDFKFIDAEEEQQT